MFFFMSSIFSDVKFNEAGAPEVSPQEVNEKLSDVVAIDVRRADEYTGELGHIAEIPLVTLETDFEKHLETLDKSKTYVFVCRSGGRSTNATLLAKSLGFENVFNMQGGMLRWNALDLPVSK